MTALTASATTPASRSTLKKRSSACERQPRLAEPLPGRPAAPLHHWRPVEHRCREGRLFARSTRLGAVEERNRLAREIHDTLAQGLTATALQLESADALLDAGSEKAHEPLRRALSLTRSNLEEEARRSVRPARLPLEGRPLSEALKALVERWEAETGIAARYGAVNGSRPLPPSVEAAFTASARRRSRTWPGTRGGARDRPARRHPRPGAARGRGRRPGLRRRRSPKTGTGSWGCASGRRCSAAPSRSAAGPARTRIEVTVPLEKL